MILIIIGGCVLLLLVIRSILRNVSPKLSDEELVYAKAIGFPTVEQTPQLFAPRFKGVFSRTQFLTLSLLNNRGLIKGFSLRSWQVGHEISGYCFSGTGRRFYVCFIKGVIQEVPPAELIMLDRNKSNTYVNQGTSIRGFLQTLIPQRLERIKYIAEIRFREKNDGTTLRYSQTLRFYKVPEGFFSENEEDQMRAS